MQLVLRFAVCVVLGWQAAMAALVLTHRFTTQQNVSWSQRLAAGTESRLRRALGADAELLFALRDAMPPGSLLITQKVTGTVEDIKTVADFERMNARNGLLVQLTTLLYPDPFLLAAPEPIAVVEDLVRRGTDAVLCVLPGDREPGARAGWIRSEATPTYQLWRFQKE